MMIFKILFFMPGVGGGDPPVQQPSSPDNIDFQTAPTENATFP